MKTLLVMRHAKSDWDAAFGNDHERPLTRRGTKAARRMGAWLSESDVVPDLVISSTAVRALTTVELAAEAGEWGCKIVTNRDLYTGDPETVLEAIREIDNSVDRLLIAGHEPTWSILVGRLIGRGEVKMPTAAVACLDLPEGGWIDLAPATCELRWLVTPKTLKGK
jgi:phosphohistidine phosphatase